jgi:hypothetical protein
MITTLCVAIILPTSRAQTVLALLTITGGITALVYSEGTSSINFTNILHATPASEAALSSWRWLPPVSVARSLAKLMVNSPLPAVWSLVYLASCAGVLWLLLQKLFITRYHQACAKAQAHHAPRSINSRAAQQFARLCFPIARSTTRAIATKEFKIFSRDITHTVQICLLLCICFIYLRAFRNLPPPPGLQMAVQAAWQLLLLVGNIILSSFVIVSICSRFVFPSVSLEGAAFWIAQSTPLSYGELLRGKCKSWLLPLSVIASVIFGSGAMALNADARLVLVSSISGMLITYGIVGLAVGLGAVFARFDCEHATQVSMSLGGMIFITASFALVLCNTLPLTWIFGGQLLFPPLRPSFHATFVYLYLPLLVLLAINVTVTALAIRQGRRALRKL